MTTEHNNINMDNSELDATAGRLGYHSLINAVILTSIEDLGYDALEDIGTLDWINEPEDVHYNVETIRNAMERLPLNKNGTINAKPALRRIMEALDARTIATELVEVDVHFDQIDLDNIVEPSVGELAELENELANETWQSDISE